MPVARVLAPDAQVFADAFRQSADQRSRQDLLTQENQFAIQRMMQEAELKHQMAVQDEARQGEAQLGAINEFLRTNTPIAERLGRVSYQPPAPTEDEGAAFEGGRRGESVFSPYSATGRGAKALSDLLGREVTNISTERRAEIAAEAADKRMAMLLGTRRDIASQTEEGKNNRLGITEGGKDRRLDVTESGKDRRFTLGEAGKTERTNTMAGALSGENTFRTQVASADEYIKALQSQLMQSRMAFFLERDPMKKAQAAAQMQSLQQEIEAALAQQKSNLQPRTPGVTKPSAPAPAKEKTVIRGPDGKLIVR